MSKSDEQSVTIFTDFTLEKNERCQSFTLVTCSGQNVTFKYGICENQPECVHTFSVWGDSTGGNENQFCGLNRVLHVLMCEE